MLHLYERFIQLNVSLFSSVTSPNVSPRHRPGELPAAALAQPPARSPRKSPMPLVPESSAEAEDNGLAKRDSEYVLVSDTRAVEFNRTVDGAYMRYLVLQRLTNRIHRNPCSKASAPSISPSPKRPKCFSRPLSQRSYQRSTHPCAHRQTF